MQEEHKEIKVVDKLKHTGAMTAPSLFTLGNLSCGFFSILAAARGNFAATRMLEAARQHTGCAHAQLELPRYGELFAGEGSSVPYGMLYWLRGARALSGEPTMSLMCD